MASVEKVPMLQEGYEKLSAQLATLKAERPLIVDAIEEARAHGDLSENAEYHAAKERQGQVEATIGDLEDKLSRAQVIDPTTLSGDRIVFGATVTLADEDDKPVKYQIVGQAEADAKVQTIITDQAVLTSVGAPLGLSNNKKVLKESYKRAAELKYPQVEISSIVGTPAVHLFPPPKEI